MNIRKTRIEIQKIQGSKIFVLKINIVYEKERMSQLVT